MAQQLGLDLPSVPALGRADFFVAPSNTVAVALIEGWREWSGNKLVLSGPDGSGKTHLAHVWASLTGAQVIRAKDLSDADVPALACGAVAVEDVPDIAGNRPLETALFHLHNLALAERAPLLLTGTAYPRHWGITLPDLASRIEGAQSARLEAPDDTLLTAVLIKLFSDRQIMPKPELIAYLTKRMDRSFAAARDIVARLDAASLAQKKPVTRALAAAALDKPDTPAR